MKNKLFLIIFITTWIAEPTINGFVTTAEVNNNEPGSIQWAVNLSDESEQQFITINVIFFETIKKFVILALLLTNFNVH